MTSGLADSAGEQRGAVIEDPRVVDRRLRRRVGDRSSVGGRLAAAWAIFVPLVLIATVAVEAVPHVRGIGFVSQLRYAFLVPACALVAFALALLAPGVAERLRGRGRGGARGRLRLVLTAIVGLLELVAFGAALAHEGAPPAGRDGLAFDVPRALFDVDHKFVDLPSGARVHYVDVGSGETLLFLHGNPAWSFQWRDLIAGLRGSFRCVALDYPGFGLSTAPSGYGFTPREQSRVVEEFVDRLGLRDITLVMQDWGGPIGLGFAGRRPELVRQVVLGNTWAWPTSTSEVRGKFSVIVGGPIGEFAQINFNGFASFGVKNGVVRTLPPEVSELYVRPFRPIDRRGIAAFYPGQITAATDYFTEVEAGLGRLRDRPALIFWGLRDIGFPRVDLERFERAFPRHTTIELPDADHFFFEDAAPRIIQEIERATGRDRATARRQW
jgi:pimeloyl-ACP methyl ester carboxylesterase